MVMFPFLLKVVLDVPPQLIGLATFAMTLPAFLFMLPGGALADILDGRKILFVTHALAVIPPALLATTIVLDLLSYPVLLAYGVCLGLIGAFSQPARDTLLSRVVMADGGKMSLQRAVGLASMTMFACQMIGMVLAMTADTIGPQWVIALQAVILFASLALIASFHLEPAAGAPRKWRLAEQLRDMRGGVVEAFSSPALLPVILVAFLIGIFYIGSFQVLMPVLVAETYGGESWRMGLGPLSFFSGTIITTMVLVRRGGVERAGRLLAISVSSGAAILLLMSLTVPYPVYLLFIFCWGIGGGGAITLSRTIVQELAEESHRGRMLSLFSMGFMGGAPIGAITIGPLVAHFGAHKAALFPAVAMLLCLVMLVSTTKLVHIRLTKKPHGA